MQRVATFLTAGLLLAGSVSTSALAQPLECHGDLKPHQVAELFFGRRLGSGGFIGEGAWRRFVAREITPRFPDGLTIFEGRGQWRDPQTGRIKREPSTMVLIAMPGATEDQDRLKAIIEAYKTAFRQQSVGLIVHSACAAF